MGSNMRIQWRHQFDEVADAELRAATDIFCEDESKTQQQFAQDADINVMVKRFGITDGAIPPVALDPRYFGDFSDVFDFHQAHQRLVNAVAAFDALPAEVRGRFDNDPIKLYAFVNDEANAEECVKLGLLAKRELVAASQPVPAPKVDNPPAPTPST